MDYEIRQMIITLIIKTLGEDSKNIVITDETNFFQDLGFDSCLIMELIVSLEEEFEFEFSDEDNLIEIMDTVFSLQKYIESVIER